MRGSLGVDAASRSMVLRGALLKAEGGGGQMWRRYRRGLEGAANTGCIFEQGGLTAIQRPE